jgi:NADPH oxidase
MGRISDYAGAVTMAFGLRNNVLNFLFGISFERAIFWHKVTAIVFIITAAIHGILLGSNDTGFIIIAFMGLAALIYFVKDKNFEIFYYLHMISAIVVVIIISIHGGLFTSLLGKTCELLLIELFS